MQLFLIRSQRLVPCGRNIHVTKSDLRCVDVDFFGHLSRHRTLVGTKSLTDRHQSVGVSSSRNGTVDESSAVAAHIRSHPRPPTPFCMRQIRVSISGRLCLLTKSKTAAFTGTQWKERIKTIKSFLQLKRPQTQPLFFSFASSPSASDGSVNSGFTHLPSPAFTLSRLF